MKKPNKPKLYKFDGYWCAFGQGVSRWAATMEEAYVRWLFARERRMRW